LVNVTTFVQFNGHIKFTIPMRTAYEMGQSRERIERNWEARLALTIDWYIYLLLARTVNIFRYVYSKC